MIKNYKLFLSVLFLSLFATGVNAQCTWTSIALESYEYTTTVPYLVPGKVIHNTPQTTAVGAQCVRTGTRGLYMNIVTGQTGLLYSQPFNNLCVGQNYRFSFAFRNATGAAVNPDMTFNVLDGNNVVISTLSVVGTNAWQDLTMPAFNANTTSITFEIVTNIAGSNGGNDAGFDDLNLFQCQPNPILYTISECAANQTYNLYSQQTGTILSSTGVWTGPSALTNGHLGTFTAPTNTNGIYNYTIDGAVGCADSIARFTMNIVTTPSINPLGPITSCNTYTLPAITGTNITPNARYYTGTGGTGTVFNAGASITTSQTLYMYDGLAGCSDEEAVMITISTPNQAGTDGAIASCGQMGLFNLTTMLNAPFTSGGTWAETTVPPTGQLSGSNFNTAAVPSGATYTFSYTVPPSGACAADVANFTIQIGNVDDVSLGNDTTICPGTSLVLNPGVYDSYLWNNGSTNQTRTVSAPGTYWVTVATVSDDAQNVIINGDFESGVNNFTTQYIPGTGGSFGALSNPGTYAITSSPNLVHTNFASFPDHTPGAGTQMFVVNGAGTANTNVWCQNSIPVTPNTFYQFGTWVTSVETNSTPVAQLQFSIGGAVQGSIFSPSTQANNWAQFTTSWFSGANTSTQICIVNQNTSTGGNDFAIDDITFYPLCSATDTIVITNWPAPVITVSPNDTICAGDQAQLIASSTMTGLTYNWNPGAISGATLNVSPAVTTIYTASAVSPNGCNSNIVSRTVVVRPRPTAGAFVNGPNPVCPGTEDIVINGSSSIGNVTYQWSGGSNSTAQTIFVTPTFPSSNYTLTVTTPAGCSDDTTVTIGVYPDLEVTIAGVNSFCEGSSTTLSVSGNVPAMTYQWSENGQTGNTINVDHGGWIYVTGDFNQCPQAKDSIELTERPNPVLSVPGDFEICPGEYVTATVSSDIPGSSFLWTPGQLSGASNSLTTSESATYTVIASFGGCVSAPQDFSIVASAACLLVVPNVFTPNGDGNNDFFQLSNQAGLKSLTCDIVNRWGETVVSFDQPTFKWDGKDKRGNDVTEGVYFYTIKAVTKADKELVETGNVTVVRQK